MCASVVYIVAKAPRPGHAKTRLAPVLTSEQGSAMARAFLLDTLDVARRARGVAVRVICPGEADAAYLRHLCGRDVGLVCQPGFGLGAALEACFRHGLADGFGKVAVLGSDSPTLSPRVIERAFAALDDHELAIGPSEDGGYYLLGARAVHPSLFRDMVWSTDRVYAETLIRAGRAGLRAATLPRWYDVDTPEDLARLARDVAMGRSTRAPHSRRALAAIRPALATVCGAEDDPIPCPSRPEPRPVGARGAAP